MGGHGPLWELSPQFHHLTPIETQALRSRDISDLLPPDNHESNKPLISSCCVASSILTLKPNMGDVMSLQGRD